jgi:hypothetical protein
MNGKGNKHIRTDELQVELIRIALILGVNFRFGSAFVSLGPLPREKRGTLGGGKWGVVMDHTRGTEAVAADTHPRDFFLTTFGALIDDGCTVEDTMAGASFAATTAVQCHAVVGAGGVHDPVRSKYNFTVVTTKIANAVGLVTFFKNGQTAQERAIEEVLWAKQFDVPPIKEDLQAFGADMENLVYFQVTWPCAQISLIPRHFVLFVLQTHHFSPLHSLSPSADTEFALSCNDSDEEQPC